MKVLWVASALFIRHQSMWPVAILESHGGVSTSPALLTSPSKVTFCSELRTCSSWAFLSASHRAVLILPDENGLNGSDFGARSMSSTAARQASRTLYESSFCGPPTYLRGRNAEKSVKDDMLRVSKWQ